MQLIKKLTDLYIFSNIHVAIAGFSLTKITLLKYGISENLFPIFVGCSIIFSYNFIRFYELKFGKRGMTGWYKDWFYAHFRKVAILLIISGLSLLYIVLYTEFNKRALLLLSPFIFMTFFYAIPFIRLGG